MQAGVHIPSSSSCMATYEESGYLMNNFKDLIGRKVPFDEVAKMPKTIKD
jgi:hypothetical protein